MTESNDPLLRQAKAIENKSSIAQNIDDEHSMFATKKRGASWIQMKDALQKPGCVICHMLKQSTHQQLIFLLNEYVLDVTVRKKSHASFGFCNRHAWLAEEIEFELNSDGQHLGTLFDTVLQHETNQLKECEKSKSIRQPDKHGLFPGKPNQYPVTESILQNLLATQGCMVCQSAGESELYYAMLLGEMQPDEEFRNLYEQEDVLLCRPHYKILQNELTEPEAIDYYFKNSSS